MFISIPKEFFVPVIFGEGFTLNEENNNLEIDLNMYRESTGKKDNSNLKMNKEYLENISIIQAYENIRELKRNVD